MRYLIFAAVLLSACYPTLAPTYEWDRVDLQPEAEQEPADDDDSAA